MKETKVKFLFNPWLVFSFSVLIVSSLSLLLIWKSIPPEIPWFYSLPWGENQLMPKMGLPMILGVSGIVLYLGNVLSHWTKKGDTIIEQTVMVSLSFIFLMLVINMIKVLLIFI